MRGASSWHSSRGQQTLATDSMRWKRNPKCNLYWCLKGLTSVYVRLGIWVHSYSLIRVILIHLLDIQWLDSLRWLDCFLLGRFLLASRIPEASKYYVLVVNCYQLINRLLFRHMSPFAIDLIHVSLERCSLRTLVTWPFRWPFGRPPEWRKQARLDLMNETSRGSCRSRHQSLESNFTNGLLPKGSIARPHRNRHTLQVQIFWLQWYIIGLTLTYIVYIAFHHVLIVPIYLTRRGFEMTHRSCVAYIKADSQQAQAAGHRLDFVYGVDQTERAATSNETPTFALGSEQSRASGEHRAYNSEPADIPLMLPLVDLVPLNLYHLSRIFFSTLESLLIHSDIVLGYSFHVFIACFACFDSYAYALNLRSRLRRLVARLKRTVGDSWAPMGEEREDKLGVGQAARPSSLLIVRAEVEETQAMLLDYFNQIRLYSPYLDRATLLNILASMTFTFLNFIRLIQPARFDALISLDAGVQIEFFYLFFASLTPIGLMLVFQSLFESISRQLYRNIACAMALDMDYWHTKRRWASILRCYYPKKHYCFTLMNSVELSWLFCLKLFFWVFSALVIVKSL